MRKIIALVLLAFGGLIVMSTNLKAEGKADLVVHYQNWSGDYTGLGSHGWGGAEARETFDGTDEFGVYFEFNDVDLAETVGFIAVTWENGAQNWDKKETGDVLIPGSELVADQVNHVYVFQGADTPATGAGYYVAKSDAYNMLLVYADPAGAYEENLGVHAWNGWIGVAPAWASPAKIFTNGSSHTAIPTIKVAMLHSTSMDAGLLIYAGGDENKKTGDVTLAGAMEGAYGEDHVPALGEVGFAYVYSKGDAYTANDNVLYEAESFIEEAFSFRLLPMGRDNSGLLTGTFAPNPKQVFVKLSANVASPMAAAETEAEEAAALATVKSWFTIREIGGAEVAIESVDFNVQAETINEFVVILSGTLSNAEGKNYEVEFDLGLEGDANRQASLELDLDRGAPVLTFASPAEIVGKPAAQRIILVEWNKKFDASKFPSFFVTDDRDGDISHLAYVPAGNFSTINTNVLGDYTIMLRVEDRWGNVTEETFIFRVTKDMA